MTELSQLSLTGVSFWWVNHKQTHKEEINGGYIWSPKKNRKGNRNETYLNLPRTKPGDVVFSYADVAIRAIGIVVGPCKSTGKPTEFGTRGTQWSDHGWFVPIDWTMLEEPLSPKDYLPQIVPLLPEKHSPIQKNGNGNEVCYLASIRSELGRLLLSYAKFNSLKVSNLATTFQNTFLDDQEEERLKKEKLPITEKEQLVKARRGQGLFRSRLEGIEHSCRLTGVSDGRFLIASHIKPWRNSDNQEKLDENNGLLLSPHADKLFDNGWISLDGKGIICSSKEIRVLMNHWGLDPNKNIGSFNKHQLEYLEYHRDVVFRKVG